MNHLIISLSVFLNHLRMEIDKFDKENPNELEANLIKFYQDACELHDKLIYRSNYDFIS